MPEAGALERSATAGDSPSVAVNEAEVAGALGQLAHARYGDSAEVTGVRRLTGGARQEIWAFDVTHGGAVHPLILRRAPVTFEREDTAVGMATEARLIALAGETGVPVPAIVHVLAPSDRLGDGYVMTRIEGETLARRILREPEFAAAREVLARQFGAAAARIHAIDPDRARPLRESGIAAGMQVARDLYARNAMQRPVVEWAFAWLEDNRPDEIAAPRVVHGDFRNGNVVVGPEGLRAVLDWEIVHLGDPMEDLAWMCVTSWRFGGIDRPVGGFGLRSDLFAGYAEASGHAPDPHRVRFHEVLGTLRWGLSCAMMAREYQAGDRSVERAAIGRRASETEIDLLSILAPLTGMRHA